MTTLIPVKFENTPSTIAQTIHAVLQHTDKVNLSLSEVMGYTSHAFRINLRQNSIAPDSPYCFHGGEALRRNFLTLGYKTLNICPPVKTITPDKLLDIIQTVRHSLQLGLPVIGWNLFAKEFGIIYGFDDSQQLLYIRDSTFDGTITYDQLPNRRIMCLCVLEQPFKIGRKEMLQGALTAILDHAFSRDGLSWDRVQGGFRGYDVWMDAFRSGARIEYKGNALNLQVISDARRHAITFLKIVSLQWDDGTSTGTQIARLAAVAAPHYVQVVQHLEELQRLYPYPLRKKGGDVRLKENAPRSIELLSRAKKAEEQGILTLNEMHAVVNP
jgi:hypothetical protein